MGQIAGNYLILIWKIENELNANPSFLFKILSVFIFWRYFCFVPKQTHGFSGQTEI